jgi:hypothetical protein
MIVSIFGVFNLAQEEVFVVLPQLPVEQFEGLLG